MNSFDTGLNSLAARHRTCDVREPCLFHPDFNRWSWTFTKSARADGVGVADFRPAQTQPVTASEDFHLALKQNSCLAG